MAGRPRKVPTASDLRRKIDALQRHVLDPAGAIAAKFFAIVESVMTHRLCRCVVANPGASLSQSARRGARIMADLPDPVAQVLPVFFQLRESGNGRFCCKSRFALGFKNSAGCGRGFRVKM
jgi:hypothetical protein